MSNLTGQTVLVAGGAGEVGEGITRQFLAAGATVIVPSRGLKKLDELRERLGYLAEKLVTIQAEIGTEEGGMALLAQIKRDVGGIDGYTDELKKVDGVWKIAYRNQRIDPSWQPTSS